MQEWRLCCKLHCAHLDDCHLLIAFDHFNRSELNKSVAAAPIEIVTLDSEEEDSNDPPAAMDWLDAEEEIIDLDSDCEKDLPVPVADYRLEER